MRHPDMPPRHVAILPVFPCPNFPFEEARGHPEDLAAWPSPRCAPSRPLFRVSGRPLPLCLCRLPAALTCAPPTLSWVVALGQDTGLGEEPP